MLLISILILCLAACGGNEEDKALATRCAEQAAEEYYYDNIHGRSVGSGKYTGCEVSISDVKFTGGKYVVTVELKIEAIEGTYGIPVRVTQNIKYTIKISDGSAVVINTEYLYD